MNDEIEKLSEQIHKIYCNVYKADKGKEYWTKGDYSKLSENAKNYDRVIAMFILTRDKP